MNFPDYLHTLENIHMECVTCTPSYSYSYLINQLVMSLHLSVGHELQLTLNIGMGKTFIMREYCWCLTSWFESIWAH